MRLRTPLAALAAALACAAPAAADTTTVIRPPARSPVVIAGSGVKQGDRLTDGQVLLRRTTSVLKGRRRVIRITCPAGTVQGGLGLFDITNIGFLALNRYPGQKVARVQVFPTRRKDAKGSIFALCVNSPCEHPARALDGIASPPVGVTVRLSAHSLTMRKTPAASSAIPATVAAVTPPAPSVRTVSSTVVT